MIEQVYNFSLDVTWQLIQKMSRLDRFDAQWTTIEKREGQSLKQLKSIATVRSVGASTRIEGSKMTSIWYLVWVTILIHSMRLCNSIATAQ